MSMWTIIGRFGNEDPSPRDIELPDSRTIGQIDAIESTIAMVDNNNRTWGMGLNDRNIINEEGYNEWFANPIMVSGTDDITAVQVSCGIGFMYILDNQGRLFSRGDDDVEKLGRETDEDDEFDGIGMVDGGFKRVTSADCGNNYAIALDVAGDLYGAGAVPLEDWGHYMLMGYLNIGFKVSALSCGDRHAMFIDTGGYLWGIGETVLSELGFSSDEGGYAGPIQLSSNHTVKMVSCKGSHSAIIDNDDSVWTCGSILSGEGGIGQISDSHGSPWKRVFENAQTVACGTTSTFIIGNDGLVWGAGDVYDRSSNTMVKRPLFTDLRMTATDVVAGNISIFKDLRAI